MSIQEMSLSQANLFSSKEESMTESVIHWVKTGLNWADYVPLYQINQLSAGIRIVGSVAYLGLVTLKFSYHQWYLKSSDAKKNWDRELNVGCKHFLRGGISYLINERELEGLFKKRGWGVHVLTSTIYQNMATSLAFALYDYNVTTQEKKEKWFDFYA